METNGNNSLTPLEKLIKAYYELGFCVLPAIKGKKRPSLNWREFISERPSLEDTLRLFEGKIDPNLCIVCGEVSGVVVLDIDGPEKFKAWLREKDKGLKSPLSIPSAIKTGKGFHIWFKHPSEDIGVRRFPEHGFELRGTGGIVIVPPSLHPSGGIYWPLHLEERSLEALLSWLKKLTLPELPDWLLEVAKEDEKRAIRYESDTPTLEGVELSQETAQKLKTLLKEDLLPFWTEGHRHELACGISGWLARLGVPQEITEAVIEEIVHESGDPELQDRLRAVRDMYGNLESEGKVKGISTVWAILGEQVTKKLMREVYTLLELEEEPVPEERFEEELTSAVLQERPFPFGGLPYYVREIIRAYSTAYNVDPTYTAMAVLTLFSSVVGNSVWIASKRDFYTSPFLWSVVVQDTGGGKTPLLRGLMKPLYEIQKVLWEKYQEELKEWKRLDDSDKKKKDPPKLGHLFAEDFTIEALAEVLSQDQRGVLIKRDEVAGLFLSLGQYKKKGGDDRQRLLELWNVGGSWKIDRKGKTLYIHPIGASIIGGIQPQILRRLFEKEDFDSGLMPRFLWLILPRRERVWVEAEVDEHIINLWRNLLRWGRSIHFDGGSEPIILNSEAKELFREFYNRRGKMEMVLPYPLSAFVPKLIEYTLRFALLHHLLLEAERLKFAFSKESDRITPLAGLESIKFGIECSYFFLWQAKRLIDSFANRSPSLGLEEVVAEVILNLHRETGEELIAIKEITARVNEKLSINLHPRLISTTLEKMGFTKEAGLRRRMPGKGNSAILFTPDMISKLSSQSSQRSQSVQPQQSDGVKIDVKENPSSHLASPDECEEEKIFTETFTPSNGSLSGIYEGRCEECEECEDKNQKTDLEIPEEIWEEI
ncbi:DUF3987 domain-containing protein [Hydrogenivirga sp. 128-5-R1-1]|uniref:DUF3987 domain-containing protein n=1 Tax=Hydrogenivirga sp. 128-5-R1-1 TaxID=392423 RepID=UPI00015F17FB|nr:DUF3987 domain-containing protein [Hydrogenivirga sp. 128-5-R1-1]EDP76265.1 hypothetical protein HG1285_18884 [Hydrogenivirga sp. 128-5-R1-1]